MFNQPAKNEPKALFVVVTYVRSIRSASNFVSIDFYGSLNLSQFFEKISRQIFGRRSFEEGSLCAKSVLARGPIKRERNCAFPTLIVNINSWIYFYVIKLYFLFLLITKNMRNIHSQALILEFTFICEKNFPCHIFSCYFVQGESEINKLIDYQLFNPGYKKK